MTLRLSTKGLFKKDMFQLSPEDGQSLIFAGDRQLTSSETQSPEWFIEDECTNASGWDETTSGTATITTDADGLLIQTGATAGSQAILKHKIPLGNFNLKGNMTMVARVKFTRTAQAAIRGTLVGFIGLDRTGTGLDHLAAMGQDPSIDGGIDFINVLIDLGGSEVAYDNNWHIIKITIKSDAVYYYLDGTLYDTLANTRITTFKTEDCYLYMKLENNAATANQILNVDYVKFKYGA